MPRKRGPKVIWVCLACSDCDPSRAKARKACETLGFRWPECKNCPGPVKYVRHDK